MTFAPDYDLVTDVHAAENQEPRRNGVKPSLIILHYTGMSSAEKAIDWLSRAESGVSCHYVIGEDGRITQLVPESLRAWHAGASYWRGETDVNSHSVGIEIQNPGHQDGYPDFPPAQMRAVIALGKDIMRRHRMAADGVLAHSDVAPGRKVDPGEKFNWALLAKEGLGLWVRPSPVHSDDPGLGLGEQGSRIARAQEQLASYGYNVEANGVLDETTEKVLKAFQSHFRPRRIDGRLDRSTEVTLGRLIEASRRQAAARPRADALWALTGRWSERFWRVPRGVATAHDNHKKAAPSVFKPRRPEILILLVAIYIALVLNLPFWRKFAAVVAPHSAGSWLYLAASAVAIILAAYLVLLAISLKPVLQFAVLLLLPVTAAASYFMSTYGIVIDANMVRDVLETDRREAGDLITVELVLYVALLGVLPALVFCFIPWTKRSFKNEAVAKLKFAAVAAVVLVASVFPVWGDYLSLFREHRELKMTLTPLNYISALSAYWRKEDASRVKIIAPFGQDAHRVAGASVRPHKSLFVVVVGETARWDHFALNGYARPTNPELSKIHDLLNYPKAFSCGTDTAQSVPCMFSGLGKANFTNAKAESEENLLDILKRAGVDVLWRENQAGCKGVCARVPTETLTGHKVPTFYPSTENFDDILVDGLDARIAHLARNTVIVLHMMGSHGPAYWKRYPDSFETFKPACKESQFSRCDTQGIINAYDNTIVYTDHVLARLIEVLSQASSDGVDAGMLYVSDHGESLGEHNMYLHGMPYAIAPEAQIHVPMVVWLSPSTRETLGIDQACLVKETPERVSHDNLFHSVLGIMNVATRVYDPSLDLFSRCRRRPAS